MLKLKKLFNKTISILITLLLIILCLNTLCTKSDVMFKIIGFRNYTVLSGSMEPTIQPGDVVFIKHKNKSTIELNDIVTFREDNKIITHRVIDDCEKGFITKGDNNNVADSTILEPENILGKVVLTVPKIGYILSFLSKPVIVTLELLLLGLIFFFIGIKGTDD